ncbi:unannotated protein [freshwater metagenome]
MCMLPAPASGVGFADPTPAPSGGQAMTVPKGTVVFAVGAATGGKADGRPSLGYRVNPGEKVVDSLIIYNLGEKSVRLVVYPVDSATSQDGTFNLSLPSDPQRGVGKWTDIDNRTFVLKGGESTIRKFTVSVPAGVIAGDRVGGIVASTVPDVPSLNEAGQAIKIATRVGIRTVVRVAGEVTPALSVSDLTSSFEASLAKPGFGRLTLTWSLQNTGNVRMGALGRVDVAGALGPGSSRDLEKIEQILPGDVVNQTVVIDDMPASLRLSSTVNVTPVALEADVTAPQDLTSTTSTWAVSWVLVAAVSLVLGLLIALVKGLRGRRRRGAHAEHMGGEELPPSGQPLRVGAE